MKSLILFLIIFISFEMSAQTIKTFSINQKGVPLADSKNPYSLISLIGYNRYKLMHNKSFKALDSLTLLAIQQWNLSNPKEKIVVNSFLRESDEPMKNAKGENIIIPLPDGTITFQYKVPDTIYYSFDFDQISLKYEGTDKTPTTIQLLKKSSKRSYVLAEFPTKLLCEKQLVTYERIDPVNEKKYIDQYLKHVENTKIRFNKDGLSRLIIKYPRKYYYDEYTFFDNFMFDSQYTIEEQKTKLESILRMPVNVIYDSIRYSLTNNYGEDSVIRDPKLGDLISVFKIKIDTSFSINEVHSLYRKQLINYNPESEMFEITDQTIFICIDDVKEGKLIIDQVNSKPYPTSMANKEIDLALKYDLNNNPLRDLLKPYYIHIQLVNLDQLYQVKTPKQKKSKTTLVVEQITL